jgi:hypothetical protein
MIRRLLGTAVLALGLTLAGCGQDIANEYGTLKVTIEGLPAGTKGKVKVKGGSFEKIVEASSELSLVAGEYAISAETVENKYDFVLDVAKVAVAKKAKSEVKATYSKAATLTITISGLPAGLNAGVMVKGKTPSTFSETVNASKTLTFVKPGDYDITAERVKSGDDEYGATITPSTVTVGAADAKEATVNFAKIDTSAKGSIKINITGLSAATNPKVTVKGPSGAVITTIATAGATTVSDLPIGTYTVISEEVESTDFATDYLIFVPSEKTKTINIVNATPIDYAVAYSDEFSFASGFKANDPAAAASFSSRESPSGGYLYTYAGAPYSSSNDRCKIVDPQYAKLVDAPIFVSGSVTQKYNFDSTGCYMGFGMGVSRPGANGNLSAYKKLKIKVGVESAEVRTDDVPVRKLLVKITDTDAIDATAGNYPAAVIADAIITNGQLTEFILDLNTATFVPSDGAPSLTVALAKVKAIDVVDSVKPAGSSFLATPRTVRLESIRFAK